MRNILNHAEVMDFCDKSSANYPAHVRQWFRSIFCRWVLNKAQVTKPVLDSAQINNPLVMILGEMINMSSRDSGSFTEHVLSKFKLVNVSEHEPWLAQALARFERVEWVDLDKVNDNFAIDHWLDFLSTLPVRPINYSVPSLIEEIGLWDRKLAKQKLIGSLNNGVEIVAELPAAEGHDLVLVKLLTEDACHNEGSVMHHCVGKAGYFHKHGVQIWSLRSPQSETPLATIEIAARYTNQLCVKQIKAKSNQTPALWILNALQAYFDANQIREASDYADTDYPLDTPIEIDCQVSPDEGVNRLRRKAPSLLAVRKTTALAPSILEDELCAEDVSRFEDRLLKELPKKHKGP